MFQGSLRSLLSLRHRRKYRAVAAILDFCLMCEYVPYTHKVMFKGFTRRTISLLNHNTSKNLTQRYEKKMIKKVFNKKLTNELTSPTLKGWGFYTQTNKKILIPLFI